MENLLLDLKELGYELVYDRPSKAWRVVDTLAGVDDFLPPAFSLLVFRHGYIFSVGVTLDGIGLCVSFKKL